MMKSWLGPGMATMTNEVATKASHWAADGIGDIVPDIGPLSQASATMTAMPYDVELADRIRSSLSGHPDLSERAMFGGLGFMLGGVMTAAASSQGRLMLRVEPGTGAALLDQPGVSSMMMRGTPMKGWLDIDLAVVATDEALAEWLTHGVAFARAHPKA